MNRSNYDDIVEMHRKFDFDHGGMPRFLSPEDLDFRMRFMQEELAEFAYAHEVGDLATAFDSLVDLVVVAMGTAVMMGLPWQLFWEDVHRANMSKVRGRTDRGVDNDLVKPEGWEPPRSQRILELWTELAGKLPVAWVHPNPDPTLVYHMADKLHDAPPVRVITVDTGAKT